MKHFTLWKSFLLLCALVVGSNVWADETTLTPSSSKIAPSDDYITVTYGGSGTNPAWQSKTSVLRLYAKNTITFASNNGEKITGISFSAKVNANSSNKYPSGITANVGTMSASASFSSTGTKDITWSYATGTDEVILTIGGTAGNLEVSSYVVTYTAATKTDPTISFDDGSVRVGKTLDLNSLFDSNSAGDVTYSITAGGEYASIDGSVLTGVAVGSITVKAEQATAGTYNAGEASATITVQEALTLSSIAITTAPTKTTYTEGEIFDATGMVVTATYSDASTDDVTASCTWTPSGALSPSDDKITVSYTENATTKTVEQAITVNEYVQPTTISATFNYEFLGVSSGSRIVEKTTITRDNVQFIFDCTGSNWHQGDATLIRSYKDTSIEIVAPPYYVISEVTFNFDSNKRDFGVSSGEWSRDDAIGTWSGADASIVFTNSSGRADITSVVVTLARKLDVSYADGWMSYVTPSAITFPENVEAYVVTALSPSLTREKITSAPSGTPVVLHATEGVKTYALPVAASADDPASNELKVSDGTIVGNGKIYVLTVKGGLAGFAPLKDTSTLSAGKVYIEFPTAPAKDFIGFDDGETTSIKSINIQHPTSNTQLYNLSGQRVSESYKGIVIVNGKKVIRK